MRFSRPGWCQSLWSGGKSSLKNRCFNLKSLRFRFESKITLRSQTVNRTGRGRCELETEGLDGLTNLPSQNKSLIEIGLPVMKVRSCASLHTCSQSKEAGDQ